MDCEPENLTLGFVMQPWSYVRTVPNAIAAQLWRDLFEAEGLPCRVEPLRSQAHRGGRAPYRVLVAWNKDHIADDIMVNAFILADTSGKVAASRAYTGQGRAPHGPSLVDRGHPGLPHSPGDPYLAGPRARGQQEPLP